MEQKNFEDIPVKPGRNSKRAKKFAEKKATIKTKKNTFRKGKFEDEYVISHERESRE